MWDDPEPDPLREARSWGIGLSWSAFAASAVALLATILYAIAEETTLRLAAYSLRCCRSSWPSQR